MSNLTPKSRRGGSQPTKAEGSPHTKAETVMAAKAAVQVKRGAIQNQGRKGQLQESYIIGRDSFAKISAIEGIVPSAEAKGRGAEFDRKGLSSEERRRAIIKAYQPKG